MKEKSTKQKTSTDRRRLERSRSGRDEMNLAEFPIAVLSDRSTHDVLTFQVEDYEPALRVFVIRKLTVTGDPQLGLPTAKDEEVYLALLQMTKVFNNFREATVLFTRCELIRLMGWKNRDWSYHRIATAFARLTGVRLFYENAWRDNTKRAYCTRGGFGLLDSYEIRDGRGRSRDQRECLSEFRWNSVIFESFQAGYLKKLDYETVRMLGPVARRMYRYLDKHFYPPKYTTLEYDLKTFAFEHIGISRTGDVSGVRRTLSKGARELEEIEFLASEKKRFRESTKHECGWEARFTMKGYRPRSSTPQDQQHATEQIARTAEERPDLVNRYLDSLSAEQRNRLQIDAMDSAPAFLLEQAQGPEGPLAEECRQQILRTFVAHQLAVQKRSIKC